MNPILEWSRVPGSLFIAAAAILAGCDGPTAPAVSALAPVDAVTAQSKKTGLESSVTPLCPERYDATHVLCRVEIDVKHEKDNGLPFNPNWLKNDDHGNSDHSNDKNGNGNGNNGKSNNDNDKNGSCNGNNGKNDKSGSCDGDDDATLTVSVFGTSQFNLAAVYMNTIRLGDSATLPSRTPVKHLKNGEYQASIVDLNGDRILDLQLRFSIAEMVANGDIKTTTTKLCIFGEGPGYVMGNCLSGGGTPPPPPPPPAYTLLPNCNFTPASRPAAGYRCAAIQLYGRDAPSPAKALQIGAWYVADANAIYPSWLTLPVGSLTGSGNATGDLWRSANAPFASQSAAAAAQTTYDLNGNGIFEPFLTECRLTPNPTYTWGNEENILVRTDLTIPQGATNVRIEFLVDDLARVYLNGTDLTDWVQFEDGWATSGAVNSCVTYAMTVTYAVPASLIVPGGINKLGIWAWDYGGWVNYLDYRVYADVPIS
jgi:hypothetical protein